MSVLLTWHSVTNKKNTAHALTQIMIELKMCSNDFSSFEDLITQDFHETNHHGTTMPCILITNALLAQHYLARAI